MALLEDIIKKSSGPIFNNAAQVWNHNFYWNSLNPKSNGNPDGLLAEAIIAKWGSYEEFKKAFTQCALDTFGSGWVWLVKHEDGTLDIVSTSNAITPLTGEAKPLFTCDVWEHAYYLKNQNRRIEYINAWWKVVNWETAEKLYTTAKK